MVSKVKLHIGVLQRMVSPALNWSLCKKRECLIGPPLVLCNGNISLFQFNTLYASNVSNQDERINPHYRVHQKL